MKILLGGLASRAGNDAGVVKAADFTAGQAQQVGKDLIGMFAQTRRAAGRFAGHRTEVHGLSGHRVGADIGLLNQMENRIVR